MQAKMAKWRRSVRWPSLILLLLIFGTETSARMLAPKPGKKPLRRPAQTSGCELFQDPYVLVPSGTPFGEGLSKFWAQEITGADLVRDRLDHEEHSAAIEEGIRGVAVWDADRLPVWFSEEKEVKVSVAEPVMEHLSHATRVKNLIGGPSPTGMIPSKPSPEFKLCPTADAFIENYESLGGRAPMIINLSRTFPEPRSLGAEAIEGLLRVGHLLVTSAANTPLPVSKTDPLKGDLSSQKKIITVASSNPSGDRSEFSSYGDGVAISAPSDYRVISKDTDGRGKTGDEFRDGSNHAGNSCPRFHRGLETPGLVAVVQRNHEDG